MFDAGGRPLPEGVGELVCKAPWPAQTRGFWGQSQRYLDTYWKRWEGVWAHGDFASVDEDGYWFLHGRSDDTLMVAGKRIGPTEVEAAALRLTEVSECAAVGMPDSIKGEAIWCFCVLAPGSRRAGLEAAVRDALARELGRPFAAVTVKATTALPKTRSGKVMRRMIRARALGMPLGDTSSPRVFRRAGGDRRGGREWSTLTVPPQVHIWHDGRLVPPEQATLSVWDHGFLYGDGVFEGVRLKAGRLFRLDDHLLRLRRSARVVAIELRYDDAEIREAIAACCGANELTDAHVRVILTRGAGEPGLDPARCPHSSLYVLAYPLAPVLGTKPVPLITSSVTRKAPRSVTRL